MAMYCYQSVERRILFGVRPNPRKAPDYILCGCREILACGHEVITYGHEGERLIARKRNCHECARWFGGLSLDDIKKPVQRAAPAAKDKMAGHGYYWPITFAFAAASLLAFAIYLHIPKVQIYQEPHVSVRVLQQFNTWDFRLQTVIDGIPQTPSVWHICPQGDPPLFEIGMTLTRWTFIDKGKCVEIGPGQNAYVIKRDSKGWPKIPDNCANPSADLPVLCNGEPRF